MKSPPRDRLDPAVLDQFLAYCRTREVKPGALIIAAADLADCIYFLKDGSVEVIIEDDNGHDMVLAYLNRGHFFGEVGFFNQDQATRSAWVRARTHCVIAEMSYDAFNSLARNNPALVVEIATQMAMRLFNTDGKLGDLAFVDVTGRVAHVLLDLCNEPDTESVPDGNRVRVTQPELARLVGCSREMACRVLKALQADGLIFDRDDGIVVRDRSQANADVA